MKSVISVYLFGLSLKKYYIIIIVMEHLTYNALIERKNYLNIKKSYYDNKLIKLQNKLQNVNKEIDNYKKVNNLK